MSATITRCAWVGEDPLYVDYHDREWGVPVHDERRLFEFLILEGAQAGLSWLTILRKREHYRHALGYSAPGRAAAYGARKPRPPLADPGIVGTGLRAPAAIANARAFLALREEPGGADRFLWQFVGGKPRRNRWRDSKQV